MRNAVWILFLLSGCAIVHMGRKLDPKAVAQLNPGTTTRAQALKLLGPPYMKMSDLTTETWTYMFTQSSAVAMPIPFVTFVNQNGGSESLMLQFKDDVLMGTPKSAEAILAASQPAVAAEPGLQRLSNTNSKGYSDPE